MRASVLLLCVGIAAVGCGDPGGGHRVEGGLELTRDPGVLGPADLRAIGRRGLDPSVEFDARGGAFVWTRGEATLLAVETVLEGPRRLEVRGFPVPLSTTQEQRLVAAIDGRALGALLAGADGVHRLEIPGELLAPGRHELELRPSIVRSLPEDPRRLGFAMSSLSIGLVEPPAGGSAGELRWRWVGAGDGEVLSLGLSAGALGLRWSVVVDPGTGSWEVIERGSLPAGGRTRRALPLSGDPASVWRAGVRIDEGELDWIELALERPQPAPTRPVVLLTLDTTRRDALGIFSPWAGTPHLDGLARRSTLYPAALSPAPVTAPTHASLFLSADPHDHGLRNNGQRLEDLDGRNLVARLRAVGYRTAGFVSLGVLAADLGFAQGFEHFDDALDQGWWRFAAEMNPRVLEWIERNPPVLNGRPGFLWVHYSDPHKPYGLRTDRGLGVWLHVPGQPARELSTVGLAQRIDVRLPPGLHAIDLVAGPGDGEIILRRARVVAGRGSIAPAGGFSDVRGYPRLRARAALRLEILEQGPLTLELVFEDVVDAEWTRRRYADEVREMDRAIGELLGALERSGWMDDVLVAVVADHGEDLGEGGHFGHVEHLGPTLSHVPFFLFDARRGPARIEAPVSVIDLAPTLVSRLGLPAAAGWSGVDADRAGTERVLRLETFPPEAERHHRALVRGTLKIEGTLDAEGQWDGALRLFDLATDPGCRVDLLAGGASPPEELAELARIWAAWGTREAVGPADPKVLERLRALGYLD